MGDVAPIASGVKTRSYCTAAAIMEVVDELRAASPTVEHAVCCVLANRLGYKAMVGMS